MTETQQKNMQEYRIITPERDNFNKLFNKMANSYFNINLIFDFDHLEYIYDMYILAYHFYQKCDYSSNNILILKQIIIEKFEEINNLEFSEELITMFLKLYKTEILYKRKYQGKRIVRRKRRK